MLLGRGAGQTYDLGSGKKTDQQSSNGNDLSWGAGIGVARQARAADEALKRNDFAGAVAHAQQAVNEAPQDAELWFLLDRKSTRLNSSH